MEPGAAHRRDAEPVPPAGRGLRRHLRVGRRAAAIRPSSSRPAARPGSRSARRSPTATSSPTRTRWPPGSRRSAEADDAGRHPLPAAAVPHLRPDRRHELRDAHRLDADPHPALRPGDGAEGHEAPAAPLPRRADHVPDPGPPPRRRQVRPVEHRGLHQRRRAARARGAARLRGGHRRPGRRGLRPDRGVTGHALQPGPRRAAARARSGCRSRRPRRASSTPRAATRCRPARSASSTSAARR